ncbi:transposase IS1404 [Xanthomonas oryzae pv. oryzae PXO86]|nr:transposase IS1404 [Xanthomonas oryzae pv. oryzae PXO86]
MDRAAALQSSAQDTWIQNAPRSLLRGGPQKRCESELNLPAENTRLKKLLAEQVFQNDLIKDALQKQW